MNKNICCETSLGEHIIKKCIELDPSFCNCINTFQKLRQDFEHRSFKS
jgi:hypothetical protein